MALNARQAQFIREFLVDMNATRAAQRAGYSSKTASAIGHENLKKPEIQIEIAKRQADRLMKADLSAARTLEELRRLSFSSIKRIAGEVRTVDDLARLSDEDAAAIASVELLVKDGGDGAQHTVVKIKLWPKVQALEILAKHFQLVSDTVEVEIGEKLADALRAGRQRVAEARARRLTVGGQREGGPTTPWELEPPKSS